MPNNVEEWKPLLFAVEYAENHLGLDLGWPRLKQWQQAGLVIMRGINAQYEEVEIGRGWLDRLAKRPASDPHPADTTADQLNDWENEGGLFGEPGEPPIQSVVSCPMTDRPQRSTISPDIAARLCFTPPPPEVPTNDDVLYFETDATIARHISAVWGDTRTLRTDKDQVIRRVQVRMDQLRSLVAEQTQPAKCAPGTPGVGNICVEQADNSTTVTPTTPHTTDGALAAVAACSTTERARRATDEQIHQVISAIYDYAEKQGMVRPNLHDIGKHVRPRLCRQGLIATSIRIQKLADDKRHAERRGAVGRRNYGSLLPFSDTEI
jgi:hypothetical protein